MKGIVFCSICAVATLTLGWGWPRLTQTIRPAPAIAAAMGTMGSIAAVKPSPHRFSDSAPSSRVTNGSVFASPSSESHSSPSEIAGTLPVAGLIGLLAFGGVVGLQLARRRI